MVVYICKNCKKEFNKKSNYINHIENKKKPCLRQTFIVHQKTPKCTEKTPKCTEKTPKCTEKINTFYNLTILKEQEETNKGYICNFCKTSFTRSTTLKRHLLERCKIRKEEIREKEAIFQELLQQNILLKDQNEKLNNKLLEQNKLIIGLLEQNNNKNSIQNNKNIKNQNNGIINNIIIQHGKEDLSKIDDKVFLDAFLKNSGAKIPEKIIEGIHFNSKYPEFKNIYISDINREKVMIYNGNDWILTPSNNITTNLLEKSIDFSENRYDELDKKILNQQKKSKIEYGLKIMELMKDFDINDDEINITKEDKERSQYLREKAEEYIKLLLYNNKDYVIKKQNK
jgi:hypothetical protein